MNPLAIAIVLFYALGNALLMACLALGSGNPLPPSKTTSETE
jgi:hypothetical protein